MNSPTACLIVIGNEILSGRTQDQNIAWLAKELNECGVRTMEVRVIPDIHETIVETVNVCRKCHSYLFTTGGIGPTHDDITSAAIAAAFGVKLMRHKEAEATLARHYGAEKLNAARLKMAEMPEGATLIPNPVSAAPGFHIGNVYVMAGVPAIMQAMFGALRHELKGGAKMLSRTLSVYITEGLLAAGLSAVQDKFPDVEIGSYPFVRHNRLGTSLVARCADEARLATATSAIKAMLLGLTDVVEDGELA